MIILYLCFYIGIFCVETKKAREDKTVISGTVEKKMVKLRVRMKLVNMGLKLIILIRNTVQIVL